MTHAHGGLLVILIALGLGVVLGNVAVGGLFSVLDRRRLQALAPSRLFQIAGLGLSLPAVLGALFVVAVLGVPARALLTPQLDHCTSNLAAPHVCFTHGTLAFHSAFEAAGLLVIAALIGAAVLAEGRRLARARAHARALLSDGHQSVFSWTDDDVPFAFTIGFFRPRVLMSSGLRRLLTPAQRRAAFAHERAHIRHLDALWRVVARVVSCVVVPSARRTLMDLLILGQEKRADLDAARSVKSSALVAETLLVMARLGRVAPAGLDLAPALDGGALEARIEALCRGDEASSIGLGPPLGVGMLAVVVLTAHVEIHEIAERLAGALLSAPVHAHVDGAEGSLLHHLHHRD